jgi:hypothetical protein
MLRFLEQAQGDGLIPPAGLDNLIVRSEAAALLDAMAL